MQNNFFQKGFTLGEMVIVCAIAMAILGLVLFRFNQAKGIAVDEAVVGEIQILQLALEEYRSSCRAYPEILETSANNGYRSNCQYSLGEFIPKNFDLNQFLYSGYRRASSSVCSDYWIAVRLEPDSRLLQEDSDWDPSGFTPCSQQGSMNNSSDGDDMLGRYDIHGESGSQ